ncbi:hypothetical protein OF83DRAFT_1241312 [Amylostereum chailletii]|nr:hypothetical protein OF83DRAFT_1241312 [Amylostereum chailletii]
MSSDAAPRASIRRCTPEDEKQVRFIVGQAQMEHLAFANNRAYFHPFTLAAWIAISSVFCQYLGWWPDPSHGILGYISFLPAFFAPAVPIMFLIDWKNRPDVEARAEAVLRRVDMIDLAAYYVRSPASGLWLLEYGSKIIALLALDASTDATNDAPLDKNTPPSAQERTRLTHGKGSSPVATIRHFFAEEVYRGSGIEDDMLAFAVRTAFEQDPTVQSVRAVATPLVSTVRSSLIKMRFEAGEQDGKVGPFGWEYRWYTLERAVWESTQAASKSG